MSFLRRIVSSISAPPAAGTGCAAPAGDRLTLGQLIHRRSAWFGAPSPPSIGFASGPAAALNSDRWPEADAGPALPVPILSGAARDSSCWRQPASDPREVAGNSEPGAAPNRSRTRDNLEVSRLTHERIQSGNSSERAVRSVFDTGAKDASGNATEEVDSGGDPPSLRPANAFFPPTPSATVSGDVRPPLSPARPSASPPDSGRAPAAGVGVVDRKIDPTTTSVERANAPGPVAGRLPGDPRPDGHGDRPRLDAGRTDLGAGVESPARAATPAPGERSDHAPDPTPRPTPTPASRPAVTGHMIVVPETRPAARFDFAEPPRRDVPAPEPRPDPALRAEPLVQIDSIEIIIEAPAPAPPAGGNAPAPAHFASRYYLRGL